MNSSLSEIGATEEVLQALLDYLIDPVLASRNTPSLSQRRLVAKQVHAAVLLYNYYLRKHYTALEYLDFVSFSKLAVILKRPLVAHLNLMHRSDYAELDDPRRFISPTEKAIMDACDISSVLDASKDVPISAEEWPISKVAVLLVDFRKENCFLLHGSTTHGVWSVIEKDHDAASIVNKRPYKRKRDAELSLGDAFSSDEATLKQLALAAIKESAGIDETDLVVLESCVVYSLSKEKTATRFYVVQCTRSITENLQVPIKDVIERLQGPLVEKNSCGWKVTPVVEYFHVLPYAGILSDWISREVCSNSLEDIRVEANNVDFNSCQRMENPCHKNKSEAPVRPIDRLVIPMEIAVEAPDVTIDSSVIPVEVVAEAPDVPIDNSVIPVEVVAEAPDMPIDNSVIPEEFVAEVEVVDTVMESCVSEYRSHGVDAGDKICNNMLTKQDSNPPGDVERLQINLASEGNELSQTALRILRMKRETLCHQLREIGDEIALCDREIQTILDGTG